jgi:rhodanese-related sulfurtransferase
LPDSIARAPAGSTGRTRRRAAAPPPQSARRSVMAVFTARPGVTLTGLAAAALLTGVIVNALFLQRGPHPAPLFAAAPPMREPVRQPVAPAPPPALTPTPVPRPAQFSTAPAPQAQPAAPIARAASVTPVRDRAADQIGDLLRGGPSTQTVATDAGGTRVAAAQRALEKLGYGVSVDGVYGAGTRAAVQRFERERNLPVTGDLNARTLRELADRSGLSVP